MNKWTLRFHSKDLEKSFNQYYTDRGRPKIIFLVQIHFLLCFIGTVVEFFHSSFTLGSLYLTFGCISLTLSIGIWKYNFDISKLFPLFTLIGLIAPYLTKIFIVDKELPIIEKIVFVILVNMLVSYVQTVQQSFIIHAVQHLNKCVLTIFVLYSILGYTYLLIIYAVFNLVWFKIDYHNVYDQRRLFQESQVNQSLDDIVTRVINDKLIVYTYNETFVRFDCHQISSSMLAYIRSSAQKEFKEPIRTLLYDTYIYQNKVPQSLSDYLLSFKKYEDNDELRYTTIRLDGFYGSRKNKLEIVIDFQISHQLNFILKFLDKQNTEVSNKKQVQFLSVFQLLTSQTLNKISQLISASTKAELKLYKLKTLMQEHHIKMQIINIKFSIQY